MFRKKQNYINRKPFNALNLQKGPEMGLIMKKVYLFYHNLIRRN